MNKKQEEYFNKLFKVNVLKDLLKIEKKEGWDGKVTRNFKHDKERTIEFIKYGFEEGIKFANEGEED